MKKEPVKCRKTPVKLEKTENGNLVCISVQTVLDSAEAQVWHYLGQTASPPRWLLNKWSVFASINHSCWSIIAFPIKLTRKEINLWFAKVSRISMSTRASESESEEAHQGRRWKMNCTYNNSVGPRMLCLRESYATLDGISPKYDKNFYAFKIWWRNDK